MTIDRENAEDIQESFKDKIDSWKDQADKKTRYTMRIVYGVGSIVLFGLGYILGSLFN